MFRHSRFQDKLDLAGAALPSIRPKLHKWLSTGCESIICAALGLPLRTSIVPGLGPHHS